MQRNHGDTERGNQLYQCRGSSYLIGLFPQDSVCEAEAVCLAVVFSDRLDSLEEVQFWLEQLVELENRDEFPGMQVLLPFRNGKTKCM